MAHTRSGLVYDFLLKTYGDAKRAGGDFCQCASSRSFSLTRSSKRRSWNELRLRYLHAHQIAVRVERDAVKAAGIPWLVYQRFMKRYEKPIEEEKKAR